MRHLITLEDVSSAEIETIYAITEDLKTKFLSGIREPILPGRMMALLFEKQSLRTRVSFEACMTHLGGGSILLGDDAGFGKRESIADFTRVLSEMVDVIVVRSKKHSTCLLYTSSRLQGHSPPREESAHRASGPRIAPHDELDRRKRSLRLPVILKGVTRPKNVCRQLPDISRSLKHRSLEHLKWYSASMCQPDSSVA